MKSDNFKIGDQVVIYEPLDFKHFAHLEDWKYDHERSFIARIEGFNNEKDLAFLSMVYVDAFTKRIEISRGKVEVYLLKKATKKEVEVHYGLLYK